MQSRSHLAVDRWRDRHVQIVDVDAFCLHAKCHPVALFLWLHRTLATSQPGRAVFECLCMTPKGLRSDSFWKWWPGEMVRTAPLKLQQGFLPEKVKSEASLCSTKMGSLSVEPLFSTLCPSITSTCSTSRHCSAKHEVMPGS